MLVPSTYTADVSGIWWCYHWWKVDNCITIYYWRWLFYSVAVPSNVSHTARTKFGETEESRGRKLAELKLQLEKDLPDALKNRFKSDEYWDDYLLMFLRISDFKVQDAATCVANHLKIVRAEPKYFKPALQGYFLQSGNFFSDNLLSGL